VLTELDLEIVKMLDLVKDNFLIKEVEVGRKVWVYMNGSKPSSEENSRQVLEMMKILLNQVHVKHKSTYKLSK
jgi:hypothetical protein